MKSPPVSWSPRSSVEKSGPMGPSVMVKRPFLKESLRCSCSWETGRILGKNPKWFWPGQGCECEYLGVVRTEGFSVSKMDYGKLSYSHCDDPGREACRLGCRMGLSWFFSSFIFISWRLITLQYCSGFCHTLT